MDFTFDYKKNLQALSGYRIANPKPLDARTVVNTRADIAEFASVAYPGLLVYVIAEKKFIVFNGTDWEDFKGSSSVDDSTITQIQGDINRPICSSYCCMTFLANLVFAQQEYIPIL